MQNVSPKGDFKNGYSVNTGMHLEICQTSDGIFSICGSFQFIIDIWHNPNAFKLIRVSYYNEVWLSLTGIFECYEFMARLIAFFLWKLNGGSPLSAAH